MLSTLSKFQKSENFIGKGALLMQKEQGVRRKLVQFLVDDFDIESDIWPWGGEPIYRYGDR